MVDTTQVVSNEDNMSSEETTLMARIPLLAGNDKKSAYLAYRSTGFTVKQSAQLVHVNYQTIKNWRAKDKEFARIETHELQRLQDTVGNDVIRFEFLRNMRLLLKSDMSVIFKGINNVNDLSPREYELFKNLRRFYTPADMLSLEKILHPEKHKDGPITIQLSWGNRIQDTSPSERRVQVLDNDPMEGNDDNLPAMSGVQVTIPSE